VCRDGYCTLGAALELFPFFVIEVGSAAIVGWASVTCEGTAGADECGIGSDSLRRPLTEEQELCRARLFRFHAPVPVSATNRTSCSGPLRRAVKLAFVEDCPSPQRRQITLL